MLLIHHFQPNLPPLVGLREKKNSEVCFWCITVVFCSQLAVANNRIITLQEEMERVKEESSYILESSRKVGVFCVCVWMIAEPWGRPSLNPLFGTEFIFPCVSHTNATVG